MVYQPTSSRSNFSDINFSGKIIIHFNLLTHRFRIPSVFSRKATRNRRIGYPSPHLSDTSADKSYGKISWKVGLQSISPFIESINHLLNSHLASSLLLHIATSPSIHSQLWDKGSRRDVYFFNVLRQRFWVRKSWYNRFSVFEVGLLPRHCSFSTSCNRRMSIWLQGTSLVWSLIRKHTRQVFSYLVC